MAGGVPLMLCVRGEVNLICSIVTNPMATVMREHHLSPKLETYIEKIQVCRQVSMGDRRNAPPKKPARVIMAQK
jgi:hypothetical protein